MISIISSLVFSLVTGYVFGKIENTEHSFLFVACLILLLTSGNLISIIFVKNEHSDGEKIKAKSLRIGMLVAFAGFFVNVFSTPSTWGCIIVYTVLYQISPAGIQTNSNNILFDYVDREHIVQAVAIKNSIAGICGFSASIGAGKILEYIRANNNMIFGIHIYGQQILSAISALLWICAAVFTYVTLERNKITDNT